MPKATQIVKWQNPGLLDPPLIHSLTHSCSEPVVVHALDQRLPHLGVPAFLLLCCFKGGLKEWGVTKVERHPERIQPGPRKSE